MSVHPRYPKIPGWFPIADEALFEFFLGSQQRSGNLVEIGVYMGRSAATVGRFLRPEETFTVVDLFGAPVDDDANSTENAREYADLSRKHFEKYYRDAHSDLPIIVEGPSTSILASVAPGSCRFVHVDASHLFEYVEADVRAAKQLLKREGVVVLDDFRSAHTPGVAAAVWREVFDGGLTPLVVSSQKMYATWGEPDAWFAPLDSYLREAGFAHETQQIANSPVRRVWENPDWKDRWVPPGLSRFSQRVRGRRLAWS